MRIMTFNLRFDNQADGLNSWGNRRDLAVQVIMDNAPSILGTQEGTPKQLEFLLEHLPGYHLHAPAREWDETCQYPTIFFKSEEFNVKEGGDLWLSTTPHIHRSKDWDSAFPRMMSFALLECRRSGRQLWAVVTHLDHIGVRARREQAEIIRDWIRDRSAPTLLMGDFNDSPGSAVHRTLTSPEIGLRDTWEVLGLKEDDLSLTHHGFLGTPQKCRMDWILASSHFRVTDAVIIRDHFEGRYPSDHYPYVVDLDNL